MSSSQSRSGGERMIHQDYIARVRYSNALPPPPNPPKLLDIPNTGLASGQYTAPAFASRLAREQPLNIEADAELGMPLDLVGMPGVFDGDESSIQAPAQAPPVHPHDRLLLRPLSTLGKPKIGDTAVSFLRRTEYISSVQAKPKPSDHVFLKSSSANPLKRPEKRKASPEPDRGTPAWIKRRIEKSFAIAAANLADRARVKHPSKRGLRVVDAFPVLPDLDAFPDSGAYVTVKFATNPVNSSDAYDTRLLSGIFKPIERTAAEEQLYETARAAWERDPASAPKPSQMMNYDLFLPADATTGDRFRAKFDLDNADRVSRALYTSTDAGGCFRFPRVRAYETAQEKEMDHDNKYDEEVILAFRDADEARARDSDNNPDAAPDSAQKAVYYYPVMQRTTIRSQRTKNIARTIGIADEEETHLDELHVQIDDPSDELRTELRRYKAQPVGDLPEEEEEEEDEDGGYRRRARSVSERGASESPARGENGGRQNGEGEEEEDAEGDADE
ncbi:RNA polymerase II-associated protein 1 [Staphylotrichum tortipilum]|uniref:RNA polymerase II-associated protein 1 n=1 Tax=Staphylotrichum tortipilum TaxID=2831512 RepID=A0AAN6MKP6_9PEZI|nr:RNA polymerase II-associated protein 1 [Staphylotrichum longicolle]